MKQDFKKMILDEVYISRTVSTHHLSDFYYEFAEALGLNATVDYKRIQASMRYHLNKLVKEGLLLKSRIGTEHMGKTDFGHNHYCIWYNSEN